MTAPAKRPDAITAAVVVALLRYESRVCRMLSRHNKSLPNVAKGQMHDAIAFEKMAGWIANEWGIK